MIHTAIKLQILFRLPFAIGNSRPRTFLSYTHPCSGVGWFAAAGWTKETLRRRNPLDHDRIVARIFFTFHFVRLGQIRTSLPIESRPCRRLPCTCGASWNFNLLAQIDFWEQLFQQCDRKKSEVNCVENNVVLSYFLHFAHPPSVVVC